MAVSEELLAASYAEAIADGYEEYRKACYGDQELLAAQLAETRQAFLSGIHWLASQLRGDMSHMQQAVRGLVLKDFGVRASETPASEPTPES